jgi:DNA-binding response OmpR family regulator
VAARVLLVEDHPTMRGAVRMILEAEGYDVSEAADGTTALEAIRRAPPDLVVLDLNIPGISGEEVLREVKSDPATAAVRVVVATAEGEEGRAAALRLGADEYVTKPFGPTVLLRTIARVLEGSGSPEA